MERATMSDDKHRTQLSIAGWFALFILVAFLAFAVWYGVAGWYALGDVRVSAFGWVALILGSLVTIVIGAGLMALVFYSSRHDMDR
jgi:hypothetical protein